MALPFSRHRLFCCLVSALLTSVPLFASDTARFDLAGPSVAVHVTRDGKTLPIAIVPTLKAGDQLWLRADLPDTQSVKYLLVVVFLRGTTNPPPESWFTRIETWNKRTREGVSVVVPEEAQQVILFLAPETGGDFSALRSAVRGRPGVFVRASQDLAEAGFEQARIEKYLNEMKAVPPGDPKALAEHSDLLARTLNLKPNPDCFKKPVDQQYGCLTQTGTQSLLDDGHGESIVASLTSGASSDLIASASATSLAGAGAYSAYVGAIVDLVRITSGLHTAHYSYIPAIAFPNEDNLNLRLNTPPSFQNPKSVIVIGLPAIQAATPPPLRAADPKHVTCLLQPGVALPVEGAPLVFSTSLAHNLALHLNSEPAAQDLSLTPDAFKGGLAIGAPAPERKQLTDVSTVPSASTPKPAATQPDNSSPAKMPPPPQETATVHGEWGFDSFSGPTLPVQNTPGTDWKFTTAAAPIIAGQENHILLSSTGTACIQSITVNDLPGGDQKAEWKPAEAANTVDVSVMLKSDNPGALHLSVHQYGKPQPDAISAQTFSKPADLTALEYHTGDTTAMLTGSNLGEVKRVDFAGNTLNPTAPIQTPGNPPASSMTSLPLKLAAGTPPHTTVGEHQQAQVTLADGRVLTLPFTVRPERPTLTILSKRVERASSAIITLLNQNDVPLDATLMLSLRSTGNFPRDSQVEIASEDGSLHNQLTIAAGSLVLQDRHTVLAHLDLKKTFGDSAFGPLLIRLVTHDGVTGDWQPLATLVRLPTLTDLHCSGTGDQPCSLNGTDLFLINSLALDEAFTNPVTVPDGFVGATLTMQKPTGPLFYLKLRDDPASTASVSLPVQP